MGASSAVGLGDMYYLLWSVERVAVAYSLPTIGKKDWYAWGSELLLDAQHVDGGWTGKFDSGVDTSFALLFLRRVNLTRDLTAFLKGRDPMEVALRGGGVMERKGEEAKEPAGEEERVGDRAKGRGGEKERVGEAAKAQGGDAEHQKQGDKETGRQGDKKPEKRADDGQTTTPPSVSPTPPLRVSPSGNEGTEPAARLSEEFLKASGAKQEELLEQLKQTKGAAYTSALAAAIDQVNGPLKTKAREALAERLARMTAATLRDMLQDEMPEIRRAAALACAMKDEKEFIPDLARLLEDPQPAVVRAAYGALKALTGEDFGPSPNALPESRRRAGAAYAEWWEKQSSKARR
jgi:hypothetical protein